MATQLCRPDLDEQRVDVLGKAEVFEWLDEADRAAVAFAMAERTYNAGEMLFQQGDPGDYLLVIVDGGINITLSSEDGREVMLNRANPGDLIGEMALVDDLPRSANAVARTRTRVLCLDRRAFDMLRETTKLSDALLRFLCGRLRKTMDFAESVALYNLEARLARLLLYLATRHGRSVGSGTLIDRKLPQGHLGQMINAARPNVNMQIQAWRRQGFIDILEGCILITDSDAIRTRAQLDY